MGVTDDEDLSVLGIPRKESPTPPENVANFPRTFANVSHLTARDITHAGITPATREITAPSSSHPGLPSVVLDVECAEDKDVEWLWTETPEGRYVSGYRLVSREQTKEAR
jgi:hypothetical protein